MNTQVEQDQGQREDDRQPPLPVLAIAFGITTAGVYSLIDTVLRSEGGFRLAIVAGLLISASILWALVGARAVAWLACGSALFLAWVAVTVPVGERFGAPFTDLSVVHPVYLPLALLLLALAAAVVARGSIVLAWVAALAAVGVEYAVGRLGDQGWGVLLSAFVAIEFVRRSRGAAPPVAGGSRLATALLAPTVGALLWLPTGIGLFGYALFSPLTGGAGKLILFVTLGAMACVGGGWWSLGARGVALTLWGLAVGWLLFLLIPGLPGYWFVALVFWPGSVVIVSTAAHTIRARNGAGSATIAIGAAVIAYAFHVQLGGEVPALIASAVVGLVAAAFPVPLRFGLPAPEPAWTPPAQESGELHDPSEPDPQPDGQAPDGSPDP